ncbi:VIT domain-containing protein [Colwellia sp. E2M01]|uniref:VIT domain-containing protein n=1 Tax=Colwellia sp. E2M01 TaxID=2841561 RepID=UPI001C080354|nr:VIT domain-containing protein [Colwellia sp. E2M01]MBU2870056.1 VWA domain-containing protein [Colwellia sp. E2M01]
MKLSPTFINTLIISGVLIINVAGAFLSMESNADEMTNNTNLDPREVNRDSVQEVILDEVSLNDVNSGTLLFKQNGKAQFLQAPQLKTEVDITINGIVANVKVKQKFTNTSNEWQHGVYAFPLPDDSAINQLTMRVGERVIIGEIQEKSQARNTFNNAKKSGKKAALVEQHRPNLFTTNIANIPPNETVEVELVYFQQVSFQQVSFQQASANQQETNLGNNLGRNLDNKVGEFSLHFPMAITPRYQPNRAENFTNSSNTTNTSRTSSIQKSVIDDSLPQLSFQTTKQQGNNQTIDLSVNLFSGAELSQLNSINHSLISTNKATGHYALKLTNQPMNKDFKLVWQYQQQDLPQVLNFQQSYHDKNYGLLMLLPGSLAGTLSGAGALPQASDVTKNKEKASRELTFILDTSGSMAGNSLAQAKQAFKYALSSLQAHDSFQLIAFNSYPTQLFSAPVAASNQNKEQAWRFVAELKATGGTEIKSALDLALKQKVSAYYKTQIQTGIQTEEQASDFLAKETQEKDVEDNNKLQQIVFLTDGAVGNEAEIFIELAKNIGNKRLFTVGLGSAPNRFFMKKAAEIGRGSYQFISNQSELVKEMNSLFTKLSQPVLTNLALNIAQGNNIANQGGVKQGNIKINTTPNPIPDVYAGEPLFLSYQMTGTQKLADNINTEVSGIYQGKPWSFSINDAIADNTIQNEEFKSSAKPKAIPQKVPAPDLGISLQANATIPPLATLWARRKIADHFRQLMLYKEPEAKANIIALALEYHLITPFTSLVAVEQKISRPANQTAKAKQLTNTLPAGQKLPSTALNWQLQFNAAICLLLMSVISLMLLPVREKSAKKS